MKLKGIAYFHHCIALTAILCMAACSSGGDGGSSGGSTSGLNGAQAVTGRVTLANGDPFPEATVYIPGATVNPATSKASRPIEGIITAPDGTTCADPPTGDQPLASTCSSADGTFTIDTSSLATNSTQIVCRRGNLVVVGTLDNDAGDSTYALGDIAFDDNAIYPVIAVVTGVYDRMEDVLAKLGDSDTSDDVNGQYGRVNSTTGIFVYGSEYGTNMTIIDGTGSLTPIDDRHIRTVFGSINEDDDHRWNGKFDANRERRSDLLQHVGQLPGRDEFAERLRCRFH